MRTEKSSDADGCHRNMVTEWKRFTLHRDISSMIKPNLNTLSPYGASLILSVAVLAGCQRVEQGYWTKQGLSQAQFNTDYRRDFRECAREGMRQGAIADGTPESDTIRMRHLPSRETGSNSFTECMNARGYEWVTMQPLAGPDSHSALSRDAESCPKERLIVDPFGYPHCASEKHSQGEARSINVPRVLPPEIPPDVTRDIPLERSPEVPQSTTAPVPEDKMAPPQSAAPTLEPPQIRRRAFDESLCIQLSQASLSSPYDTFLRCMEEKGWSPSSK
jgi:hypothetical protein